MRVATGTSELVVSALAVFPLKGARGIALERAGIGARGIEHDRRFMLVDPKGDFVTQREAPRLALVGTALEPDALVLRAGDGPEHRVPLAPAGERRVVTVWDDRVSAIRVPGAASEAIARWLGRDVELVFIPEDADRRVSEKYGEGLVSFADGFPLLLATEASLADLSSRIGWEVPMPRFRPNLVVRGGEPWWEDRLGELRVGDVRLAAVKPCSRCVVVNVDPATGEAGKEPLATLATFRALVGDARSRDGSAGNKVLFGQNLVVKRMGTIRVGDPVAIDT
jgi:uncharacterized protein YcbX